MDDGKMYETIWKDEKMNEKEVQKRTICLNLFFSQSTKQRVRD